MRDYIRNKSLELLFGISDVVIELLLYFVEAKSTSWHKICHEFPSFLFLIDCRYR